MRLAFAANPTPEVCRGTLMIEEQTMQESFPYAARYHRPDLVADSGHCSQHGDDSCTEMPVIELRDPHNPVAVRLPTSTGRAGARGELSARRQPPERTCTPAWRLGALMSARHAASILSVRVAPARHG